MAATAPLDSGSSGRVLPYWRMGFGFAGNAGSVRSYLSTSAPVRPFRGDVRDTSTWGGFTAMEPIVSSVARGRNSGPTRGTPVQSTRIPSYTASMNAAPVCGSRVLCTVAILPPGPTSTSKAPAKVLPDGRDWPSTRTCSPFSRDFPAIAAFDPLGTAIPLCQPRTSPWNTQRNQTVQAIRNLRASIPP